MKAYVLTTLIGTFAIDDMNRVIYFEPFEKDIEKVAEKLKEAESKLTDVETRFYHELKDKGYRHIVFNRKKEGVEEIETDSAVEKYVRNNLFDLALKNNFIKDRMEFNRFLTKINVELTKSKIKRSVKKDSIVVQVNGAIEELHKSINIFTERLYEWYGLHFPEMERNVSSHEKFIKLVEKFGKRTEIDENNLKKIASSSMGIELSDSDIATVQLFASEIHKMYDLRENLEKYLEKLSKEVAPNFTEVAGPKIAAKLIAKAGGLERLAKMTSNTIQLLGSEKALFRFLHSKGKSKSPKYGIIFSHPLIQDAPEDKRGKLARVLSSKLSMAVKIDYFSREDKIEELKKGLEEKVKEVLSS